MSLYQPTQTKPPVSYLLCPCPRLPSGSSGQALHRNITASPRILEPLALRVCIRPGHTLLRVVTHHRQRCPLNQLFFNGIDETRHTSAARPSQNVSAPQSAILPIGLTRSTPFWEHSRYPKKLCFPSPRRSPQRSHLKATRDWFLA